MPTNSSIDDVLAILEENKDILSSITVADVLTAIDEATQEELLSYLTGTGYGLDTVEQGKALLAGYPATATLYTVYYDLLSGMSGGKSDPPEYLEGTDGNDTLITGSGNDTIIGGAGDDSLLAGAGNDNIYGGAGNDILNGGTGADYMEGGTGADTYFVDNKKDVAKETDNTPEGGSGLVLHADLGSAVDTVIASVKYTLTNYVENLTLADSTKKLAGTGNALGNEILGNAGSNKLSGLAGNDTIDGGAGADKLSGGAGADTFRFANLATGGADTVSDFAEEDLLAFDTSVFTALAGAGAGNFVAGASAVGSDDYLVYNAKSGTLYYDADGSGAGAAIKIVALKGADAKTVTFDDLLFL